MKKYLETHSDTLIDYGLNILIALLLLFFGFAVIRFLLKIIKRIMKSSNVDETLQRFACNLTGWALKILLFIMVAAKLGVETTSFAALIAAAGLGVGFALQGALGNLAGGVIIMLFRPFNIGDFIEVQGEKGIVTDIQIFSTIIRTLENKTIYIPNGALSNGNISNISKLGYVRVSLFIGVDYSSDIKQTKKVLMDTILAVPNVRKDPPPSVNVSELADSSINFSVFTWANVEDYWQIRAGVLQDCKEALDAAGIEIPFPHQVEIHKQG